MRIVHILHEGFAFCGAGMPKSWPADHRWVSLADYPGESRKNSFCHECEEQYKAWTIPIEAQPDMVLPFEECCFCFTPTPLWTNLPDRTPGEQVACCLECSQKFSASKVPTKQKWCSDAEARSRARGVSDLD